MNKKNKEKKCKYCEKLLIKTNSLFCRRCVLEGRNKIPSVAIAVVGAGAVMVAKKGVNKK